MATDGIEPLPPVYVIAYNPSLGEVKDARYHRFTEQVYLHDNEISGGGKSPDVTKDDVKALSTVLGGPLPDVLYDGLVDPAIRAPSGDKSRTDLPCQQRRVHVPEF